MLQRGLLLAGTEPDPVGTNGPGRTLAADFAADFYITAKVLGDPTAVHVNYAGLYVDAQRPGIGYDLGEERTKRETDGSAPANGDPRCPFSVLCTADSTNIEGVYRGYGAPVGSPFFTNGACAFGFVLPETVAFSRPVRSIEVSAVARQVWIDTLGVNPPWRIGERST